MNKFTPQRKDTSPPCPGPSELLTNILNARGKSEKGKDPLQRRHHEDITTVLVKLSQDLKAAQKLGFSTFLFITKNKCMINIQYKKEIASNFQKSIFLFKCALITF